VKVARIAAVSRLDSAGLAITSQSTNDDPKGSVYMRLTLGRIGVVAGVMATAAAVAIGASTSGAGAAPAAPAARQAAAPGVLTSSATGSFTDAVGGAGKFAGTFTPQRFSTRGGQLLATGVVTGTLVDSAGSTLGSASQTVTT
jgi:hypothetical protein